MNPLTKVKLLSELNEREAQLGVADTVSWHSEYKDSAWIFLGSLPYKLTEGDIICVFSQFGEIVNVHLARDKKTGKSKGFCFLCYEDQRSTILAVDNFNGIKIKGRTIRVDHLANGRAPKDFETLDETNKKRKKAEEKPEQEVTAEPLPSSSSPSIKVIKEEPGLRKHYSNSNRAPKAESRGSRKQQPSFPEGRWEADPERKEKPKVEPKSSSKREGRADKSQDWDQDGGQRWDLDQGQFRSTNTNSGWPSILSEGRSHWSLDQVYRHKKSWPSRPSTCSATEEIEK
ncbi:uncharacterized protein LOC142429661 [Tenrec ecaudatus]|uniref:uncharacterized protein LOC142429661 n=1 Tax=Tenrec ecaudatus TaxID=94439 RepID=UPI003F59C04F